ncbi:MAG: FKBP-type peptidyl-prolyl cis-trans isomerase [Rhodobacteraceae bacterium]|nr:FKBP-type peptidyl-prolyl cis-trans isomerase [Paracoccaceae bacterium]
MKHPLLHALALGLLVGTVTAADSPDLSDATKKASYAIGMDIAQNFKQQELGVDGAALAAGIIDSMAGKSKLTEAEAKAALDIFRQEVMAQMAVKQQAAGAKNIKAGEDFLAANGKKAGVKTTASGLQYKVLKSGNGKTPKLTDTVTAHYHGTLIDGTVFDSSVERGEPVPFPVNGVIPGWTEALQLMKEGDKWQLVIPAKLAYGERGAGGKIGPNSALVFDVELLKVEAGQ